MSAADDFAAQVGAQPKASPVDQFAAQVAQPVQAQQQAGQQEAPGFWQQQARQLGLLGRAAVTGITGIPVLVADGLNSLNNQGRHLTNWITGGNIPDNPAPSASVQHQLDQVFPTPATTGERLAGDIESSIMGLGPTMAAGKALKTATSPTARAIGQALTSVPGNQVVAAGGAGASAGLAREAGLGPAWQLGAAVLGGTGSSLGAASMAGAANRVKNAVSPPTARPGSGAPAVEAVTADSPTPPSPSRAQALAATADKLLEVSPAADPTAAARAADAKSIGMSLTLGQQTRDPALFAKEQNWRGLPVGAPLLRKFNQQNTQLADALESAVGKGGEPYADGKSIISALQQADDIMRARIGSAYRTAEQASGAKLNVPLQGVAQDYASVLHNFGDKVPSGVRNNFNELGLMGGTQRKIFGVDDAENLLKVINANHSADPATNAALAQLSQSVKKAILSADDQGGVFAAPRQLAAQRFELHDNVPALADAVAGKIAPEDFTRKYLVNGSVDGVTNLVDLLKQYSPQTLKLVQGQMGDKLKEAAFGMNPAGDAPFTPVRYAKALENFGGAPKLEALYGPEATDNLFTIGRVGSYIHSEPSFSPVNRSNTGSAVLDMASHIPMVGSAINAAGKRAMVARALRGELQDTAVPPQGPSVLDRSILGAARQPVPPGQ